MHPEIELHMKNFYQGKIGNLADAADYFTGDNCHFLEDCRKALASPGHSGNLAIAGDWLLTNPVASSLMNLLRPDLTEKDTQEKQRLYDLVKQTTFLTLCLHATKYTGYRSQLEKWLLGLASSGVAPAICACWREEANSSDGIQHILALDLPVELRDLLDWLLNSDQQVRVQEELKPQHPLHTVSMFVLGWNGQSTVGYRCILALEHYASGYGFYRHPTSLFLPCDTLFLTAIENACSYIQKQGFQWTNSPETSVRRWTEGTIRWRLYSPDRGLETATGGSIGGAFGTGMILLLQQEESDRIGITACIDSNGNLLPVEMGSIGAKARAAIEVGLYKLIVCPQQKQNWRAEFINEPDFEIEGIHSALEAAQYIAAQSGPRRALRRAVQNRSSQVDLLSVSFR